MSEFERHLQAAKRGDRDAAQQVLLPHLSGLTGFVRLRAGRLLRDRESCADLVQSVCRVAIEGLDSLESEAEPAFRQWLYSIALNKILERQSHYRAQKRDPRREVPFVVDSQVQDTDLVDCYAQFCTPSRDAIAREEVARIEAAFDSLPEEDREMVVLYRFVGMSHQEIAERQGRSEVAVRKQLSRARARLAVILARPSGADDRG